MNIKATELIRAALALADLQNSSVPTAEENRFWINTAFARVYQQAINMGEKYFFDTADYTETDDLPTDFYQLYDIRDASGQPIRRYQKWMTANERSYDIRGDKLVLTNPPASGVTISYFKQPNEMDPNTSDPDLDFPNHIFYQICVIYLAQYYKIKQGADTSQLDKLSNDLWNTYYDILRRDVNQPLVIQDVYHTAVWGNGVNGVLPVGRTN